jgi:hypothetical protein
LQGGKLALSGYSLPVIASEAKQSISPLAAKVDCFVANAPRNDGEITNGGDYGDQ